MEKLSGLSGLGDGDRVTQLGQAGFRVVLFSPFTDPARNPSSGSWADLAEHAFIAVESYLAGSAIARQPEGDRREVVRRAVRGDPRLVQERRSRSEQNSSSRSTSVRQPPACRGDEPESRAKTGSPRSTPGRKHRSSSRALPTHRRALAPRKEVGHEGEYHAKEDRQPDRHVERHVLAADDDVPREMADAEVGEEQQQPPTIARTTAKTRSHFPAASTQPSRAMPAPGRPPARRPSRFDRRSRGPASPRRRR